jgi:hypothetical protein
MQAPDHAWSIVVVSWNSNHRLGHFAVYEESFASIVNDPDFKGGRFLQMPKQASQLEKLNILDDFLRSEKIQHVFLPWLHDLGNDWTSFNEIVTKHGAKFSGLAALTHLRVPRESVPVDIGSINTGIIWANAIRSSGCVGLLTWDPLITQIRNPKIKTGILKDFQPSDVSIPSPELIDTNVPNRVGFFGQLFAYRGLSLFIEIATKNPDIQVFAVGKRPPAISRAEGRKEAKLWRRLMTLPNVTILDRYIHSDQELNFYISKMQLICLDTRNYPVPSGIVTRARNLGTPVAITSSDSAIFSIYSDDPGVFILDRKERISELIRNIPFSRHEISFQDFRFSLLEFWKDLL